MLRAIARITCFASSRVTLSWMKTSPQASMCAASRRFPSPQFTVHESPVERTGKPKWKVLLHYHLTFPLSNLLLLLLGLPFVLRPGARSIMLGMVIAIVICGAYFAFDAMMRNLGEKENLHPVLAAWFAVIFFGSLGVVLLDSVKT